MMTKENVFEKALLNVVENRVSQIICGDIRNCEQYKKLELKRSNIFSRLESVLITDEQKSLLDDLESIWNLLDGFVFETLYQQGLKDAHDINEAVNVFGIRVNKEVS